MKDADLCYENTLKQYLLPDDPSLAGHADITMFSSLTEEPIETIDLGYWRQNLESRVRFDQATQRLLKAAPEIKLVVEIGPHSALAAPLKTTRAAAGYRPERLVYVPRLKRNTNSVACILKLVGRPMGSCTPHVAIFFVTYRANTRNLL